MHVRDALDRLDVIHDHLTRAEEYRGFRAAGVALAGVIGLSAAAAQPFLAGRPEDFVGYWVTAACVCGAVSGGPALYAYVAAEDEFARRRTRRVLAQFLPCVLAGAAVTAALSGVGPETGSCLPGVWALLFGLGMVAARPYLPPAVGGVAVFYLAAGVVLLTWGSARPEPSGWAVGGVFGPGHLAAALILAAAARRNAMSDPSDSGRYAYDGLDRVLHEKARLGVLTALVARPRGASFSDLARLCGLTDGNLSRHLDVLAEARLVEVTKKFEARRPLTTCKLTTAGRRRFREYLAALEQVLRDAAGEAEAEPRPARRAGWATG